MMRVFLSLSLLLLPLSSYGQGKLGYAYDAAGASLLKITVNDRTSTWKITRK